MTAFNCWMLLMKVGMPKFFFVLALHAYHQVPSYGNFWTLQKHRYIVHDVTSYMCIVRLGYHVTAQNVKPETSASHSDLRRGDRLGKKMVV